MTRMNWNKAKRSSDGTDWAAPTWGDRWCKKREKPRRKGKRRLKGKRQKVKASPVAGDTTARIWTAEEIDALKSPKGGWTKAALAQMGVPWPPPKGWRQRLMTGETKCQYWARKKAQAADAQAPSLSVLMGERME